MRKIGKKSHRMGSVKPEKKFAKTRLASMNQSYNVLVEYEKVKTPKTVASIFTPFVSSILPFYSVCSAVNSGITVPIRMMLSVAKQTPFSIIPMSICL